MIHEKRLINSIKGSKKSSKMQPRRAKLWITSGGINTTTLSVLGVLVPTMGGQKHLSNNKG